MAIAQLPDTRRNEQWVPLDPTLRGRGRMRPNVGEINQPVPRTECAAT